MKTPETVTIKNPVRQPDPRPPHGGWATGNYMRECRICHHYFTGDKQAVCCADCAYDSGDWPTPYLRMARGLLPPGDPKIESLANLLEYEIKVCNIRLTRERDALKLALSEFIKRYDRIGYSDLPPPCKSRAYQILGSPDQALAALAMSEGKP